MGCGDAARSEGIVVALVLTVLSTVLAAGSSAQTPAAPRVRGDRRLGAPRRQGGAAGGVRRPAGDRRRGGGPVAARCHRSVPQRRSGAGRRRRARPRLQRLVRSRRVPGACRRRHDRARGRAACDLAQPTRLGPGPGRHERRTDGGGVPLRQPRRGRLERRGRRPPRLRVRRLDPPHGHRSTGDGCRGPRPLRPLRRVVDAHHDGSTEHRARDIGRTCAARRVGSEPVSRRRPIRVVSTTAPLALGAVAVLLLVGGVLAMFGRSRRNERRGQRRASSSARRPAASVTGSRQAKRSHT